MQGYFGGAGAGMDVDFVPAGNVYPTSNGGTLASLGSAASPDLVTRNFQTGAAQVSTPATGAKPLAWWFGIAIIVALILFIARKTGDANEFSNLRASTYNVSLITLIAILGITVMKIIAVKIQNVPGMSGLSSVIIAA